jgi:hypothetical protein
MYKAFRYLEHFQKKVIRTWQSLDISSTCRAGEVPALLWLAVLVITKGLPPFEGGPRTLEFDLSEKRFN